MTSRGDQEGMPESTPSCEPSTAAKMDEAGPSSSEPSHTDVIEALKRKIVDLCSKLQSAEDARASMELKFDVEKREHVLTTSKLSTMLKKRATATHSAVDEPPTDVCSYRQQIGQLREQLAQSQDREGRLEQQYNILARKHETLRQLTLEGFRSHRSTAPADSPAAESPAGEARGEHAHNDAAPAGTAPSQSAAVGAALRLAMQPVALSRSPSDVGTCPPIQPPETGHAQPRISAMPRSTSMPHPHDLAHSPAKRPLPHPSLPFSSLPSAGRTMGVNTALAESAAAAADLLSVRQDMLARAPLGYAKGAICIEPPKRQRNVTSVIGSQRVAPRVAERIDG